MTHNLIRILPGTHLYIWVESSNVDKVPCWRTKVPRYGRESNPEPFDSESRVQSNIPRHLKDSRTRGTGRFTLPVNLYETFPRPISHLCHLVSCLNPWTQSLTNSKYPSSEHINILSTTNWFRSSLRCRWLVKVGLIFINTRPCETKRHWWESFHTIQPVLYPERNLHRVTSGS